MDPLCGLCLGQNASRILNNNNNNTKGIHSKCKNVIMRKNVRSWNCIIFGWALSRNLAQPRRMQFSFLLRTFFYCQTCDDYQQIVYMSECCNNYFKYLPILEFYTIRISTIIIATAIYLVILRALKNFVYVATSRLSVVKLIPFGTSIGVIRARWERLMYPHSSVYSQRFPCLLPVRYDKEGNFDKQCA